MKFYFFPLFISLLVGTAIWAKPPGTVHALFFVDTNDTTIGMYCQSDLSNMNDFAFTLANTLGFDYSKQDYSGAKFKADSFKNLFKTLENKTDSNDIILLYISSHGVKGTDSNPYPNISFSETSNESVTTVYKELKKLPHRILLTLTDACNVVVPKFYPINLEPFSNMIIVDPSPSEVAQYKELFGNANYDLIVTSCQPGEASFVSSSGSVFTNAFLLAIRTYRRNDGNISPIEELMKATAQYTFAESELMCGDYNNYVQKGDTRKFLCKPFQPKWEIN